MTIQNTIDEKLPELSSDDRTTLKQMTAALIDITKQLPHNAAGTQARYRIQEVIMWISSAFLEKMEQDLLISHLRESGFADKH